MSLGDLLGNLGRSKLFKQSLNTGDVFLKEFEGIDHPKFFIVAGISQDRIFLCSIYINSRIHPSVMQRQHLLELQVPLKKQNNPFLKYDSFANCSTPIPMESEPLSEWVSNDSCKVIGSIYKDDLSSIVDALKNSGLLSEDEIELYF
jgi:hypothetical protein